MSTPTSLKAKGKKKVVGSEVAVFEDSEDTGKAGYLSESSDSSDSSPDSDSDSDSVSSSSSSSVHESGSGTNPRPGFNDPQLSKDELLAYLEDMRRRFSAKRTADSFAEQDEVLIVTSEEKDLPKLNPGKLPESYFTFETARSGGVTHARNEVEGTVPTPDSRQYLPAPPPPPPEVGKSGKPLTKKEKKALKTRTAGKDWFDLAAPAEADLPRLYREYEALRLRNHLDPKRFYRKDEGEGKGIKGLPKHFAIGTVLPTKTPFGEPSKGNLTRAERKRTLVEELVHDSEARDYAKKKFKQMQEVRGMNGRGRHTKKKAIMRPKW